MGLAVVAALLLAEISPEQLAQVQYDRDKAMAEVAKKYGDKLPSEMTPDERRELIQDQRAVEDSVLEKNGVDAKELARYEATLSLDDRAATKAARQQIEIKEKQAAEKKAREQAEKAEKANQPVQIQRGFNDSNPVILEDKQGGNGAPTVERGLPPDAIEDQNAASGKESSDTPKESKPSGKSKRK